MSLYELMDCDECVNDNVSENINDDNIIDITTDKINQTVIKKSINCITYIDSIEYLKYSNQYMHDKLIIANKQYKENNVITYKLFKELGLIRSSEKYTLEYYIKTNYKLVNSLLEQNSKKLQSKNLLTEPKKFFVKKRLHGPVQLSINIENQTIRGTLYDKAISYIYDKSIDFLTVVRSCKTVESIDNLIVQNKIINSDEMIQALFGDQLNNIKLTIDNVFTNMLPCKMIYSHDTKTYGYPDFIADNWIVDVKTSKSNILNMKNYLQVIAYAICVDVNNICLYDIENGFIYTGHITSDNIKKIKECCGLI